MRDRYAERKRRLGVRPGESNPAAMIGYLAVAGAALAILAVVLFFIFG